MDFGLGGDFPWPRTDAKVYEYACHEGNYALGNIMRGARLLEQDAEAQFSRRRLSSAWP